MDGWNNSNGNDNGIIIRGSRGQGGISTSLSGGASSEETSPAAATVVARRYRRRMISFGDDRDYDSLQYDIESGNDDGNNNNNYDDGLNRQGRGRGGSFSIHLNDDDDDDDHLSDDESDGGGDTNNDLIPLEDDVDFNVLADTSNNEEREGGGQGVTAQQQRERQQFQYSSSNTNDYGCEVLTFGRADHCALGVPQLSSRIRSGLQCWQRRGQRGWQ